MEIQDFTELVYEEIYNRFALKMEDEYDYSVGDFYHRHQLFLKSLFVVKKKNEKIYFLTINPRPDVSLSQLQIGIKKLMTRVFMKGAIYTYEQRGVEEAEEHGAHVHIVFDKRVEDSPSQILKYIQNTFKNLIGNNKKMIDKYINLKTYPAEFKDEKVSYLKGEKWDVGKEDAVKTNILWRTKNNLELIYYN